MPRVDLDDADIAIIVFVAARGPGLITSAPERVDQFARRPAEMQRSLDKLKSNNMLDSAFGSTDGFENDCLSRPDTSIVRMLGSPCRGSAQRREQSSTELTGKAGVLPIL
jgi:hypothetical protein